MTAHSHIGASSMHRWSKCPGSVRLSKGIPNQSSKYAEEGTRAHEVASDMLLGIKKVGTTPPEMLEAVQVYVDAVLTDNDSPIDDPRDFMLVEHKFDLSTIHPGLFGTADCVTYSATEKLLRVYDYKHGAGIGVDVQEEGQGNVQLMYYGLGALLSTNVPCAEVELVIVQPRCPHPDGPVRRFRFKSLELLDFASDVAIFASRTENHNAPIVPGDHCRFCPAAAVCPSIHEKALAAAKEEFSPSLSYDPAKLSAVLEWLPTLEGWAKNVREFAYGEAQHGRCPPGWKLVAKRATRKWKNEDEAVEYLRFYLDLSVLDIQELSLKSPTQIEKVLKDVGKDKNLIASLLVSESSGLSLAHESDKRPAAKPDAMAEFTKIESNDSLDVLS